jgi:type I restriction enzyme R subunit
MTFKTYYQLEKAIQDDPSWTFAAPSVAWHASPRFIPPPLARRFGVIVEHFWRHVLNELDGRAKAMIVTGSREHALRYYLGVREYKT